MAERSHRFEATLEWTGNLGTGTDTYKTYSRDHVIGGAGKPPLPGSADPVFRGDGTRYNPEELLVAALSSCHLLWYLHLCAKAGVICEGYTDHAVGTMVTGADGAGQFSEVVLHPEVTIRPGGDPAVAARLHADAHHLCFIARSVNFPVKCEPRIVLGGPRA